MTKKIFVITGLFFACSNNVISSNIDDKVSLKTNIRLAIYDYFVSKSDVSTVLYNVSVILSMFLGVNFFLKKACYYFPVLRNSFGLRVVRYGLQWGMILPSLITFINKLIIMPSLLSSTKEFSSDIIFLYDDFKQPSPNSLNIYVRGASQIKDFFYGIKKMYSVKKIVRSMQNMWNCFICEKELKHNENSQDIYYNKYLYNDIKIQFKFFNTIYKMKDKPEKYQVFNKTFSFDPLRPQGITFTEYEWTGEIHKDLRIQEAIKFARFLKDQIYNASQQAIRIMGHSYGGVLSIHALYILYKKGLLKNVNKKIYLYTLASPLTAEEYYALMEMLQNLPHLYYCGVFFKSDCLPNSDPFNESIISTELWLNKLEKNINKNCSLSDAHVKIFSAFQIYKKNDVLRAVPNHHNNVDHIIFGLFDMDIFNNSCPNRAYIVQKKF